MADRKVVAACFTNYVRNAQVKGDSLEKFIAFQILIALAIGALIYHFFPDFGMALRRRRRIYPPD